MTIVFGFIDQNIPNRDASPDHLNYPYSLSPQAIFSVYDLYHIFIVGFLDAFLPLQKESREDILSVSFIATYPAPRTHLAYSCVKWIEQTPWDTRGRGSMDRNVVIKRSEIVKNSWQCVLSGIEPSCGHPAREQWLAQSCLKDPVIWPASRDCAQKH